MGLTDANTDSAQIIAKDVSQKPTSYRNVFAVSFFFFFFLDLLFRFLAVSFFIFGFLDLLLLFFCTAPLLVSALQASALAS